MITTAIAALFNVFLTIWVLFTFSIIARAQSADCPDKYLAPIYTHSKALVIGIDRYEGGESGWPPLSHAKSDARMVAEELERHCFEVIQKHDLDKVGLFDVLDDFFQKQGNDSQARLVIWISAHGYTIDRQGYIVPAGMKYRGSDPKFVWNSLPLMHFNEWMHLAKAKHVLVIINACFAGTIFAESMAYIPPTVRQYSETPVRELITSGDENQEASDDGAFAETFVSALKGETKLQTDDDGFFNGGQLGLFLQMAIANYSNSKQQPMFGKLKDPKFDKGDIIFRLPNHEVVSSQKNSYDIILKISRKLPELSDMQLNQVESFVDKLQRQSQQQVANFYGDSKGFSLAAQTASEFIRQESVSSKFGAEIASWEIGNQAIYDRYLSHPRYLTGLPSKKSGVVIGIGYDLRWVTLEQFYQDWGKHLKPEQVRLLEKLVSKTIEEVGPLTGPSAQVLSDIGKIEIPWSVAVDVFSKSVLDKRLSEVISSLPNSQYLSEQSAAALTSLVIDRGTNFDTVGDQFTEMREIKRLIDNKQFTEVPAQIRQMKRLFQDLPASAKRRDREADMFEKGLIVVKNVPVPVPSRIQDVTPR
ncbi:MAG: caspase family protein [Rhodomicrobium sp.]